MPVRPRPMVLVVLDGFGLREAREANAVRLAKTPRLDRLYAECPWTALSASGRDVGLPDGQMGNSEVGHLNLGAGRVVYQDVTRIDMAIEDGSFAKNEEILRALRGARDAAGRLHLLGLVSPGGVHSSLAHLLALVELARREKTPVVVHAFLDGRDTPPKSAGPYLAKVEEALAGGGGGAGVIGTVGGRYFAMDRDKRWDRVERAYRAIAVADGPRVSTAAAAVERSYAAGVTDEFAQPVVVGDYAGVRRTADTAVFFNFRADRARQLTRAIDDPAFNAFARPVAAPAFARFVCMSEYDATFGLPVAFPKIVMQNLFCHAMAAAGLTQFRCAETEKYAHVTYFFNGGVETPVAGEERLLVPSIRDVATYDRRPEMRAREVADAVVERAGAFDFILVNFANPDMIGHTGKLDPAIRAVEAVDASVGRIVDAALAAGGACLVTADHGNCEQMIDPSTGQPHTAHTTNPVPLILAGPAGRGRTLGPGRLSDVAPTMLALMSLPQPPEMTGRSLLA